MFVSEFLSTPTTLQQGPASAFVTQAKVPKDPSAPKKTKAKTSKPKKDSTADVESSDDLEIEDEPPEVKPALLVVSAPTDEKGKALYNAVEAVWYPRNKSPQAEDVRKGIAAFGETVRFLRDAWKAKNDSLKKAELPNSDTAAEAPHLKEEVAHYRQTMESVISRSLQYGHDAIVRRYVTLSLPCPTIIVSTCLTVLAFLRSSCSYMKSSMSNRWWAPYCFHCR